MAEFSRLVITNKGQALLAKMMTGEGNVEFTKISTSDMEYTLEQLEALTEFSGVKQTVSVSKVTRTNGVAVTIETTFDNTELTQGYHMRALGLYAIDPDDGEILYAVTAEVSGCCYMPAYNGVTVSGACIKLVTTVGNAENVSLEVDPGVYATVGEIKELRECVDGFETWKDNTQKRLDNWGPTIVGHGQVINSLRDSIGNLKPVATSGDYNDLANRPSIPAAVRVKGNAEPSYRTGDVNLTAANIGALPISGGTVTGDLRIKGSGNYGTKINLGDGDYVHIYEAEEDCLEIKAKKTNFVLSDNTVRKFTINGSSLSECHNHNNDYYTKSQIDAKISNSTGITSGMYLPLYGGTMQVCSMNDDGSYDECSITLPGHYYWEDTPDGREDHDASLFLRFNEITFSDRSYSQNFPDDPPNITTYKRDGITCSNFDIGKYRMDSVSFFVRESGKVDLGTNTNKWKNVYTVNGMIQTSDRNRKNTIKELASEKAKVFIYGLKPSTYQMNEGTSGRTHWGLVSQDIEELFEKIGLTSFDFAGFIKSPKIQRITEDENGNKLQKPIEKVIEGEYDYSLRYDEFIAPIIKVIQSQHEEIETLKQETQMLKQQMQQLMNKES